MASLLRPLFSSFLSLLFLLLHLGCFFSSSSQNQPSKKRKLSSHRDSSPPPPPTRLKSSTAKTISSSWSYIKRIFSSNKPDPVQKINSPAHHNPSIPSPSSSTRSLQKPISSDDPINRSVSPIPESDIASDQLFLPLRNDIYPCTLCGEVFQSPIHLEQHQSIKHAISQLTDGDSGNNIVRIIFQTGWADKSKNPVIHRILKINNSKRVLTRFEDYRECVKQKASRNAVVRRDERCIADGNELLRFHCTTFLCELGQNGNSSICTQQYCSVCGIIKSGFSHKMDGISMQPTSWRGHVSVPEDIEEEFGFMNVKRAMLVCRVIAGRIGCDPGYVDKEREWSVAQVVEYFHLLPYKEILSNWHSRERLSNGLQDLNVEMIAGDAYDVHIGGSSCEKEVNQGNVAQPMIKSWNTHYDDEKIVEAKRKRVIQGVSAVGLSELGSQHSEDGVSILASKEYAISQSALALLRWKREKLHYQLRIVEDEIALCNKSIQKELNGGENEAPVDGCNDMCVKGEGAGDGTNQLVEDQCTVQYSKGKRLSEAILTLQNQCQQLDELCCSNNWVLPTYRVSPLEGGFLAKVTVKAADSKVTSKSDISETVREARESAAARMIASFYK